MLFSHRIVKLQKKIQTLESFGQPKASEFDFFSKHLYTRPTDERKHKFEGEFSASLKFQNNTKNNQNKRKSKEMET